MFEHELNFHFIHLIILVNHLIENPFEFFFQIWVKVKFYD